MTEPDKTLKQFLKDATITKKDLVQWQNTAAKAGHGTLSKFLRTVRETVYGVDEEV